jgi:uncharacterized protein YaaR (DUF327 family)
MNIKSFKNLMKKFHKTVSLNVERESLVDINSRLDTQSDAFFASRILDTKTFDLNSENK